jgi:hypothetical protein
MLFICFFVCPSWIFRRRYNRLSRVLTQLIREDDKAMNAALSLNILKLRKSTNPDDMV